MNHAASRPTHEQIAEFRVGAVLATQAIAVYIDCDGKPGNYREAGNFEDLPDRLKIRVLAACEDALRRRKEDLMRRDLEREGATDEDSRDRLLRIV
jgi:hypothetical protein